MELIEFEEPAKNHSQSTRIDTAANETCRISQFCSSKHEVDPVIASSAQGLGAVNVSSSSGAGDIGKGSTWDDSDDANTKFDSKSFARQSWLRSSMSEKGNVHLGTIQGPCSQRQRLNGRSDWACMSGADKAASADKHEKNEPLSREGAVMVENASTALSKPLHRGTLEATRLQDANVMQPSSSALRTVEFHHHRTLLLTAGLDKTIRLFDIVGGKNHHVKSVFLEDLPIYKAGFCGDGSKILASGRRRFIYSYDISHGSVERVLPTMNGEIRSLEHFVATPPGTSNPMLAFLGEDGNVPLISLKSMSCIASVKMNGSARSATFSSDGLQLMTAGEDSVVYFWDLRNQKRCIDKLVDQGAVAITSLASSACNRYLAVGSDRGAVNFYENADIQKLSKRAERAGDREYFGNPDSGGLGDPGMCRSFGTRPTGTIFNLTTEVNEMNFNADGQILAVSSHLKRDSLRLVHTPSCTVFADWPSSKTPLQYVWSTAFSSCGDYFAVGNARGRALLYRIHAYGA